MFIATFARKTAPVTLVLVAALARPAAAQPIDVDRALEVESRGPVVGQLHDTIVEDVMHGAPLPGGPFTLDQFRVLLARCRVEALAHLDLTRAGTEPIPGVGMPADLVAHLTQDGVDRIVDLYLRAGAFEPAGKGQPEGSRVMEPLPSALPAVIRQLGEDGTMPFDLADRIAWVAERGLHGGYDSRGELESALRTALAAGHWQGRDAFVARATVSTMQASWDMWEAQARRDGKDPNDPVVACGIGKVVSADFAGAAIGSAAGGFGAAVAVGAILLAGAAIVATGGAALPVLVAIGAGATATAAIGGAVASIAQALARP